MVKNTLVLFKSHPDGMPTLENFEIVQAETAPLEDGQFLLENVYLSLDPYMRMFDGRRLDLFRTRNDARASDGRAYYRKGHRDQKSGLRDRRSCGWPSWLADPCDFRRERSRLQG